MSVSLEDPILSRESTSRLSKPESDNFVELDQEDNNQNYEGNYEEEEETHQYEHDIKMKKDATAQTLKMLEPGRKKLSTLETQRIMGILDNSYRQMQIITGLPSAIFNIEDLSTVFTRNLVMLIENYKQIKLQLDKLYAKTDAVDNIRQNRLDQLEDFHREETLASEDFWASSDQPSSSVKSIAEEYGVVVYKFSNDDIDDFCINYKDLENEISTLSRKLIIAIKCVLIAFKSNPTATKVLTEQEKEWKIKRGPSDIGCLTKMKQLKDAMTMKLTTTPLERDETHSQLRKIHQKHKANCLVIVDLEEELSVAIQNRDKEVQEKNEIIRKLQMDIHHITKIAEDNKKKINLEMDRQIENDEKNSESVCQKLKQEISQKRSEYNSKLNEGRSTEKELRSEKFKLDSTLETILQRYDDTMTKDQIEFEAIEAEHNEEKKQLEDREERFKALEEEYLAIMEERRIEEEKREALRQEENRLAAAVITIQSFWRSYKVRKGVRGKKGKKGKGKKKK